MLSDLEKWIEYKGFGSDVTEMCRAAVQEMSAEELAQYQEAASIRLADLYWEIKYLLLQFGDNWSRNTQRRPIKLLEKRLFNCELVLFALQGKRPDECFRPKELPPREEVQSAILYGALRVTQLDGYGVALHALYRKNHDWDDRYPFRLDFDKKSGAVMYSFCKEQPKNIEEEAFAPLPAARGYACREAYLDAVMGVESEQFLEDVMQALACLKETDPRHFHDFCSVFRNAVSYKERL